MPDTPALDLAALQALTDAATPGPWAYYGEDVWLNVSAAELAAYDADPAGAPDPWEFEPQPTHLSYGDWRSPADAEFIAAARTAVPALLARVADLQADDERLRAMVDPEDVDPCANRFPETWTGIVCLTCPDLSRTAPTKGTPQ
jgi:hypothetical protein